METGGVTREVGAAVERPLDFGITSLSEDFESWEVELSSTAEIAGQMAIGGATEELTLHTEPIQSLAEAAKRAKEGDEIARQMVRENVRSDMMERRYKWGQILNVVIEAHEDELTQHGQSYDNVHENALELLSDPVLKSRSVIEMRNKERIVQWHNEGLLKDNVVVIESLVPDELTPDEADDIGYFGETMSKSTQLIYEEQGAIVIESLFSAGAESRYCQRFDKEAVVRVAAEYGTDYQGMGSEEILDSPQLIPKRLLPIASSTDGKLISRGLTIMQKQDGDSGRFFGRKHTGPKDYRAQLDKCRRREVHLESEVEEVTQLLIENAPEYVSPLDATRKLHELNDARLKAAVVIDHSIDSSVLGRAAQPYVEEARLHLMHGDMRLLELAESRIKKLGKSSSCPTGMDESQLAANLDAEQTESEAGEDRYGSLQFKCQKGHVNTRPRNQLIERCRTCGISVKC